MAIEFSTVLSSGIQLPNAYAKIVSLQVDFKAQTLEAVMEMFMDATASNTPTIDPISIITIKYPQSFPKGEASTLPEATSDPLVFNQYLGVEALSIPSANLLKNAYELITTSVFFSTKSPIAV